MEETETKLRRFQEEIAEARTQESKLEGERESILKRWKDEHGLFDVEDARAFVDETEKEKRQLSKKLEEKLQQIKENYGFE